MWEGCDHLPVFVVQLLTSGEHTVVAEGDYLPPDSSDWSVNTTA